MALLLVERPEVRLEVDPRRQGDDGADLLALANDRPALTGPRSERRAQRVGRGVAAAEAPQVHDVPGVGVVRVVGVCGRRERDGNSLGHRRKVGRAGEDGRVVDVVAGPEEDRLRRRRHRGPGEVRVRAQVGPEDRVVGLHLVAVHERDDGNRRVGVGRRGIDDDHRLLVGIRAVRVPPGAVHAPAGERGRPRGSRGKGVPHRRLDRVERPADGEQATRDSRGRAVISAAPASPAGAGGHGMSRSRGAGVISTENSTRCVRNRHHLRRGSPATTGPSSAAPKMAGRPGRPAATGAAGSPRPTTAAAGGAGRREGAGASRSGPRAAVRAAGSRRRRR